MLSPYALQPAFKANLCPVQKDTPDLDREVLKDLWQEPSNLITHELVAPMCILCPACAVLCYVSYTACVCSVFRNICIYQEKCKMRCAALLLHILSKFTDLKYNQVPPALRLSRA